MRTRITMLAGALLALAVPAAGQTTGRTADPPATDAERVRVIDRAARRLAAADSFSGVVLVARGDSVLYLGAFGLADRARRVPIRADTRFELASITKTFVSVAAATLVERGRLSWDDTLGRFFPDLPLAAARERVRVRHLVTHTSGLHEFSCERDGCPRAARSLDDHLRPAIVAQRDSLLHEPGTRAIYTNSNYLLLGRIVELASGRDLHDHVRAHVFQPAGMTDTDFFARGHLPERLAQGYDRRSVAGTVVLVDGEPRRPEDVGYGSPHAGAYSTARDLLRFARALRTGRLLRPETVATLLSPKPEAGNWAYGWDVLDAERGLVGHGGSWRGISNSLDLYTGSDHTVVILANVTAARSPLRETIRATLP